MNFWAMVIDHNPNSVFSILALIVLVALSVFAFAFASEHRKREWRNLFKWIFGFGPIDFEKLLRKIPSQM